MFAALELSYQYFHVCMLKFDARCDLRHTHTHIMRENSWLYVRPQARNKRLGSTF